MNTLIIIAGIILFFAMASLLDARRMKKIAKERGQPDICTYARSFDYRNVNTKIMREVYNLVQDWVGKYDDVPFPVKSDDSFDSLYRMDPEDLDDIYFEVADKLGISTGMMHNPILTMTG